MAIIIASRKGA